MLLSPILGSLQDLIEAGAQGAERHLGQVANLPEELDDVHFTIKLLPVGLAKPIMLARKTPPLLQPGHRPAHRVARL